MKDDEVDIDYYLKLLKRHWLMSIFVFLLVLGGTIAYTMLSTPVYEAKSQVVITSQDQTSFLFGSSAPKISDLETQAVIILSPSVMNGIYTEYGYTFVSSAAIIKNSNIIEIIVEADSAERAVLIADAIAKSYVEYTRDILVQDANEVISFINGQIIIYDSELKTLNKELEYYVTQDEDDLSPTEELEYKTLQREIAAKNKVYDNLLSKKEDAELLTNMRSSNVNILNSAQMPTLPIRPNIPLNIALGAILAIGAAFIAAVATGKVLD